MAWTFPAGNVVWKAEDIIALECQPGFMSPDDWRPVTFCAVTLGESGGNPLNTSVNWSPAVTGAPPVTHLSIDLGMFQLNSYWHTVVGPYPDVPPISIAQCLDPFTAWVQTWKVLNKQRTGWHYNMTPWHAFITGAYDKHISAALAGMKRYRSVSGLPPGVFGP